MSSACRRFGACLVWVGCLAVLSSACARGEPPLTVHAAASLVDVLPRVLKAWPPSFTAPLRLHFGASSRLAKQIEAGAPGDVLFSADTTWIDYLDERALLASDSRRVLLQNQLVLVVNQGAGVLPEGPAALARGDAFQRVALAGEGVPAGRYARAALERAGVWEGLAGKVISADDVRMALTWVARGEADAGIVYATDASAEPRVRVAYTFPPDAHPPIRYEAAVLSGAKHAGEARAFLAFCASDEASRIFRAAGFRPVDATGPAPEGVAAP